MKRVGGLANYIGGSVGRMAGTGLATGLFLIVIGMSPAEFVVWFVRNPPAFVSSWWFGPALLLVGICMIPLSLRFNIWSQQQKAIDNLAEDLSWAIHHLLNRTPRPSTEQEVDAWENDFSEWCKRVSAKLENRAFFTRSDQLHFDRLGFVDLIQMTDQPKFNWLLSMLRLKFQRLRDVINWTQQRRR